MTITEKIERIVKNLKTRKSKNIIYLALGIFLIGCFGYRFYRVASERNTDVFNIVRNDLKNGIPVETLTVTQSEGVLYEPITIKNNRGYISGARIKLFKPGQSLGECKIANVSHNIDLDSGMYVIKTKQCSDGLKYAENKKLGFYIPISAVHGNVVYVADNGIARARNIKIDGRDAQNVLIESGITDGDIVILSDVKDGQKIKLIK